MRSLIITTIGEDSCVESWREGGTADMMFINYHVTPTFKYPGIYKEVKRWWDYDYYWMPDEDIYLTGDCITEMIETMRGGNIDLAQPSIFPLDHDSFPSWERFVHRNGPDVIPSDFVEIMCPAFSKAALEACIETFPKSSSGWGLDLVWSKILQERGMRIAIINSVIAKHTREVGAGGLYKALKKKGILPSRERKKLMKEYGITEHSILE